MYLYRRILLFLAYYLTQCVHKIRQLLNIESKTAPKKILPHSQRVARCYDFFHYAAEKSGAFSKYTEGRYKENTKDTIYDYYNIAQSKQLDNILNCCGVDVNKDKNEASFKLLDAGCGNGDLSYKAKYERGISQLGLTLSDEEVAVLKSKGLTAVNHSYRDLINYFPNGNEFDAVVSNGSLEHLISIEEALIDKGRNVLERQLEQYWHVLKAGGVLCFTTIHLRDELLDPAEVAQFCWTHELESDLWQYSVLVEVYSGWYPAGDIITHIAKNIGFVPLSKEETLTDYLKTSLVWRQNFSNAMKTFSGFMWIFGIWLYEVVTDPIYSYYCLAHHFGKSWTWQFEKRYDKKTNKYMASPCTHYTMTFQKPISS